MKSQTLFFRAKGEIPCGRDTTYWRTRIQKENANPIEKVSFEKRGLVFVQGWPQNLASPCHNFFFRHTEYTTPEVT